jgi:protoporphyrinogen oxidase
MKTYKIGILGGGIAGLSLASFLNARCILFEKDMQLGGLSRSYEFMGIQHDIGPHIIFSKNKEVLDLHASLIPTNTIYRSNKIFFKNRYIKYPFENDLSSLSDDDRSFCLNEFLNNPYENFSPQNMLQFFLATFGEGITRLYLQPYNEKIWKFDSSYLDMQMVERIPKPPREDVIASAYGTPTEGYKHQLNFLYPKNGGFQSLIDAYHKLAETKGQKILNNSPVNSLEKTSHGWNIRVGNDNYSVEKLINTMPIHELFKFLNPPLDIRNSLNGLLYNSIYIVMIHVKKDSIGDNFGLYIPEKDIIFHRVSKLNYLGENYKPTSGGSILMAEITFRPNSTFSSLSHPQVISKVIEDLEKCGFICPNDVLNSSLKYEKYAYVIYDLNHRANADKVLNYLKSINIDSVGRFAEFEYLNSDGVVEHSIKLANTINQAQDGTS